MRTSHRIIVAATAAAAATIGVVAVADAGNPKTPGGTTVECILVNDVGDAYVIFTRGKSIHVVYPGECPAGAIGAPDDDTES